MPRQLPRHAAPTIDRDVAEQIESEAMKELVDELSAEILAGLELRLRFEAYADAREPSED